MIFPEENSSCPQWDLNLHPGNFRINTFSRCNRILNEMLAYFLQHFIHLTFRYNQEALPPSETKSGDGAGRFDCIETLNKESFVKSVVGT